MCISITLFLLNSFMDTERYLFSSSHLVVASSVTLESKVVDRRVARITIW